MVPCVCPRIIREATIPYSIPEVDSDMHSFQDPLPEDKLFLSDLAVGNHQYVCSRIMGDVEWRHSDLFVIILNELVPKVEISLPQTAIKQLGTTFHLNGHMDIDRISCWNLVRVDVHTVTDVGVIGDSVGYSRKANISRPDLKEASIKVNLEHHFASGAQTTTICHARDVLNTYL